MSEPEEIMDHKILNGFCIECGRKRIDIIGYGHPDIVLEHSQIGLACKGGLTSAEIENVRRVWKREFEKFSSL
jgi:hypothetical protein